MRSRYTAFALRDAPYLLATWHPSTRPAAVEVRGIRWLGLTVHAAVGDTVSFSARYEEGGQKGTLSELSRFTHEGGAWFYSNGTSREKGTD